MAPADNSVYARGAQLRRAVLGDEYVEAAAAQPGDLHESFQRFMIEYCWGECWGREALPPATRSLIVIAMLGGLGRWEELGTHLRGAVRNGCTRDEIVDTLFHVAVYAGVPAGLAAFRIARDTLPDLDQPSRATAQSPETA